MKTGIKIGALMLFVSGMYYLFYHLAVGQNLGVMAPKGHIATEEGVLILIATLLMLFVVLPVIGMSYLFAWRYRAENTKAIYTPEWSHSVLLETICWGIPYSDYYYSRDNYMDILTRTRPIQRACEYSPSNHDSSDCA